MPDKHYFYFHLIPEADNVIDVLSEAKKILDKDPKMVSVQVHTCGSKELIATVLQNGVVAFHSKCKG